jgi:putative endonuclease
VAYVYILKSERDGRFYIGSTTNLSARLKHHFGGHTYSTKRFGFKKLVLKQKYGTLQEAIKVERWLKKLKRRDYVEKIVSEGKINKRT